MPDRIANPPSGEARQLLAQQGALPDAAQGASRPRLTDLAIHQVELGLAAARAGADSGAADDEVALAPLARHVASLALRSDWPFVRGLRDLLSVASARCSPMLRDARYVEAMARLAGA